MNWELQLAAAMTVEESDLLTGAKRAQALARDNRLGAALKVLWDLLLPAARKGAGRPRAFVLIHMGHVYRRWMIDVAFKYFRDARRLSREAGFPRGEMVASCSLGLLYMDWEEPDRALAHFERGLELAWDCAGLWWQRDVLVEVASCLNALGLEDRARKERRRLDRLDHDILADLWGTPGEWDRGVAVMQ